MIRTLYYWGGPSDLRNCCTSTPENFLKAGGARFVGHRTSFLALFCAPLTDAPVKSYACFLTGLRKSMQRYTAMMQALSRRNSKDTVLPQQTHLH